MFVWLFMGSFFMDTTIINIYFVHLFRTKYTTLLYFDTYSYRYSNWNLYCEKKVYISKYTNLQAYYKPKFLRQNQQNNDSEKFLCSYTYVTFWPRTLQHYRILRDLGRTFNQSPMMSRETPVSRTTIR